MRYFTDTSALVKRYVTEKGSSWVRSWIPASTGNSIIMSNIALVEVYSVLNRHKKDKKLSSTDAKSLYNAFLGHFQNEYSPIIVNSTIYTQATTLIENYGLKSLDSIQLACAIEAQKTLQAAITFVCADHKLLKAASSEGFITEDPEQYP